VLDLYAKRLGACFITSHFEDFLRSFASSILFTCPLHIVVTFDIRSPFGTLLLGAVHSRKPKVFNVNKTSAEPMMAYYELIRDVISERRVSLFYDSHDPFFWDGPRIRPK
jgi:hypothetical protein